MELESRVRLAGRHLNWQVNGRLRFELPPGGRDLLAAGEGVGLFDEVVAAPFVVGFEGLASCFLRGGFAGLAGFRLAADEIVVGGEVLEGMAAEVVEGFKVVFVHEGGKLVEHLLDAAVADFHYVGADLDRISAEEDELGGVIS